MRIGDPTGKAEEIRKSLEKLHGDLTASRSLAGAYASVGQSFPMYRVLGYRPAADLRDPALREILTGLRPARRRESGSSRRERKKLLARFREKSQQEKQFLLTRLRPLDPQGLAGPGGPRPRSACGFIENELGVPQRSVEAQLLKMLQDVDEKTDPATIKLALDVRVLAEEARLGGRRRRRCRAVRGGHFSVDSRRTRERRQTDRRAGTTFCSSAIRDQRADAPTRNWTRRASNMSRCAGKVRKLQKAFALRDEASAELPYFAAWLAEGPRSASRTRWTCTNLRLTVQEPADNLYKLNQALDAEDRRTLPAKNLVAQIDIDVQGDPRKIPEHLREAQGRSPASKRTGTPSKPHSAAPPPGGDVALRIDLLRRQRDISGKLLKNTDLEGKTEKDEPIERRAPNASAICCGPASSRSKRSRLRQRGLR